MDSSIRVSIQYSVLWNTPRQSGTASAGEPRALFRVPGKRTGAAFRNSSMGFSKPVKVGPTDYHVDGLSDTFISPANMIMKKSEDGESFLVGTVIGCQDVKVNMGKADLTFVIAQVKTALGIVPVAMSRDVFNIDGICPGKVLAMAAVVKADLSKPDSFLH